MMAAVSAIYLRHCWRQPEQRRAGHSTRGRHAGAWRIGGGAANAYWSMNCSTLCHTYDSDAKRTEYKNSYFKDTDLR